MKKTYIIPETLIANLHPVSSMLATSFEATLGTNGVSGENTLVKEEKSQQSDYNVWDDDWSR